MGERESTLCRVSGLDNWAAFTETGKQEKTCLGKGKFTVFLSLIVFTEVVWGVGDGFVSKSCKLSQTFVQFLMQFNVSLIYKWNWCLKGIKSVQPEIINTHQKLSWKLFFLYFYIKCTKYMNRLIRFIN